MQPSSAGFGNLSDQSSPSAQPSYENNSCDSSLLLNRIKLILKEAFTQD